MKIKYKPMSLREEIEISRNPPPYVKKEYKINKNRLICLGIEHTSNLKKSQFKVIKEIIDKENLSRIILEISKEQLKHYRNASQKELFKEKDFVIRLAAKKKIPLIVGDLDIKNILLKNVNKYGKENVLLLRVLLYLKNKKNLKEEINKIIDHLESKDSFKKVFESFKKEKNLNNLDFERKIEDFIFLNNNKKINEITSKDNIFPSPIENKTKLNEVVRDLSYKRDKYMINQIFNNLRKGNVLFVAGKNHVIRQEPYLIGLEKKNKKNYFN